MSDKIPKCPNCGGPVVISDSSFGKRYKCEGKGDVPGCKSNGVLDASQRTKAVRKPKSETPAPAQKEAREEKPVVEQPVERKPVEHKAEPTEDGSGYGKGNGWVPGWPD